MSFIPNIFIVGKESAGKSSLVNALASDFVACTSFQKETFIKQCYEFRHGAEKSVPESLEQTHTNNQKLRESLITPSACISPRLHKLPTKHGLQNINIVDYPCFDVHNHDSSFMKFLENDIHEAHMIIFVTDAEKPFASHSELDIYNKIKKCIEDEYEKKYHNVELIVVVNKYDDIEDKEIQSIYEKIAPKIKIDKNNLYRISSHKLLVHSIIKHNSSIVVPKLFKTEISKILKTSDISMNKINEKFIIASESDRIVLTHTDLKINYFVKEFNCGLCGDWDNLIDRIRNFNTKYTNHSNNEPIEFLDETCKNIVLLHDKIYESIYYVNIEKNIQVMLKYVNQIKHVIDQDRAAQYQFKDNIHKKLLELSDTLIKNSLECKRKTVRFLMVEILFKMIDDPDFRTVILNMIMSDNVMDKCSSTTFLSLFSEFYKSKELMDIVWNNINGRKKLLSILSVDKNYYSGIDFAETNKEPKYYYDGTAITKTYFDNICPELKKNWFISILIKYPTIPKELKYMVSLSITDIVMLQYMRSNNTINGAYLNKCIDGLAYKLELCLLASLQGRIGFRNTMLLDELITLVNNEKICKICDNYEMLIKCIESI